MNPAPAKVIDSVALENLGRATLQIVHDLKNQLNGLKLYATFLRKRLESENRAVEERETLQKLIAGLDRAAKDMTALVRYAKPMDLRLQARVDLLTIVLHVIDEAASRGTGGLQRARIAPHISGNPMFGEFDEAALTEAIKAITDDVRASISAKESDKLELHVRRECTPQSTQALIEWRGGRFTENDQTFHTVNGCGTVHTALAARIIEAHHGRVQCDADVIRVWLPISENS